MPNFTRAGSFTIGQTVTATGHNDNWAGLEAFLNTTKLDAANLQASAQPNNSAYRFLLKANGKIATDTVAGTYILGPTVGGTSAIVSGGNQFIADATPPPIIYFAAADHAVASLTQKLRIRAQVAANTTAPAITFTVGLYPVTVAGGNDAIAFALGTVVASSTVALASPSASTVTSAVNADFTIPADGAYALGVVTSGTIANNSAAVIYAYLQSRNV